MDTEMSHEGIVRQTTAMASGESQLAIVTHDYFLSFRLLLGMAGLR